jgi:hypothetical protein
MIPMHDTVESNHIESNRVESYRIESYQCKGIDDITMIAENKRCCAGVGDTCVGDAGLRD